MMKQQNGNDILNCPCCKKVYNLKERLPIILPCEDEICKQCYQNQKDQVQNQQIQCPIDSNHLCDVDQKVKEFKPMIRRLQNHIDCDEHQGSNVQFYCKNQNNLICSNCFVTDSHIQCQFEGIQHIAFERKFLDESFGKILHPLKDFKNQIEEQIENVHSFLDKSRIFGADEIQQDAFKEINPNVQIIPTINGDMKKAEVLNREKTSKKFNNQVKSLKKSQILSLKTAKLKQAIKRRKMKINWILCPNKIKLGQTHNLKNFKRRFSPLEKKTKQNQTLNRKNFKGKFPPCKKKTKLNQILNRKNFKESPSPSKKKIKPKSKQTEYEAKLDSLKTENQKKLIVLTNENLAKQAQLLQEFQAQEKSKSQEHQSKLQIMSKQSEAQLEQQQQENQAKQALLTKENKNMLDILQIQYKEKLDSQSNDFTVKMQNLTRKYQAKLEVKNNEKHDIKNRLENQYIKLQEQVKEKGLMEFRRLVEKSQDIYLLKPQLPLFAFGRKQLLYKATRDGFRAADFHRLCDNKGPTISYIISEHDQVFGGYTSVPWTSDSKYVKDSSAFVFSLSKNTKHKQYQYFDFSVAHQKDFLMVFGWGYDICIRDKCDNNNNNECLLGGTYELVQEQNNTNQSANYLAGGRKFNVVQIEVYINTWI
ncbi:tldc domain-containing protein [Stylonychia lemnae]|uniref:Tldc domain-containing protein n=1 Tax=Stylonychia lemnae TaxID=5949 RepID=A0A078A0P7_STYLE|nr:tldc domain-containing protein [Stylonychia lemnae]|eukprot:CDW75028.1 tldc domain-containing protein [Stylonychia lemnae]